MEQIVKQCMKCNKVFGCCKEADLIHTGNDCNGELKTLNITWKELHTISSISSDSLFLQAMIDLKEKDIIEFQLKMSQFKTQVEQQKSSKAQSDTRPKCPHCKSTNISKIGTGERVASVAMLGVFSKKINKSFKCKKCGYTW